MAIQWDAFLGLWIDSEDEDVEDLSNLQWIEVQSSNLAALAYVPNRYELYIAFLDGLVYKYDGVPKEEYYGLVRAESHGEYFVDNIRLVYPYERIIG